MPRSYAQEEKEKQHREAYKTWQGLAKPWMAKGDEGIKDNRLTYEEWQKELNALNKDKRAKEAKFAELEKAEEDQAHRDARLAAARSGKKFKEKHREKKERKKRRRERLAGSAPSALHEAFVDHSMLLQRASSEHTWAAAMSQVLS
eukprot:scaffold264611_cov18-Tisochrysis_lutea.AAC.2